MFTFKTVKTVGRKKKNGPAVKAAVSAKGLATQLGAWPAGLAEGQQHRRGICVSPQAPAQRGSVAVPQPSLAGHPLGAPAGPSPALLERTTQQTSPGDSWG